MLHRFLLIFVGFICFSSVFAATQTRDPGQFFFQETFGDFSEELQIAKDENKKGILIFFEMDECPFCHFMKTRVLNNPEVQDYYREHFRIFQVDIEGDIEMTDFQGNSTTQKEFSIKQYKVRATPVIAFFDLEGNLIHRHTGRTSGFEEFLWMGEFVADGYYKTERFTQYKRMKRKSSNSN